MTGGLLVAAHEGVHVLAARVYGVPAGIGAGRVGYLPVVYVTLKRPPGGGSWPWPWRPWSLLTPPLLAISHWMAHLAAYLNLVGSAGDLLLVAVALPSPREP